MPNKLHKWGFKIWGRSGISRFLYDFDLYQGRSQTKEKTEFGMCADIVLKLMTTVDHRIEYPRKRKCKKRRENSTLKQTIVNMQKCLNRIDNYVFIMLLIISGLSEWNE